VRFLTFTYLMLFIGGFCYAADSNLIASNGASIQFSSWDQERAIWRRAAFSKGGLNFDLYESASGSSVGFGVNPNSLSPSKKYALIQRTIFGELDDGQQVVNTEKSYCDMISVDTSCVLLSRSAEACSGSWEGDSWSIYGGGVITPALETLPPEELSVSVAAISNSLHKADAVKGEMFMGVDSYLSCYPAEKNIKALNDLGFYLAQAGDDSSALKIYRDIEVVGERIVLMLNIADSLWRLKRNSEAAEYYKKYAVFMSAEKKDAKIPKRVFERVE